MKFFRNYKFTKLGNSSLPLIVLVVAGTMAGLAAWLPLNVQGHAPIGSQPIRIGKTKSGQVGIAASKEVLSTSTNRPGPKGPQMPPMILPPPPPPSLNFNHLSIITTFFWVGEKADGDNGFIANNDSTWDGQWLEHFGGVDSPAGRNGYLPGGFSPKENPFYVALPYSDLTENGDRKGSGTSCPLYSSQKSHLYSWCKNSWIAIRHGGKVVYGQWEDAGPFGENDFDYVFGNSKPANKEGEKAGLDVSPAVRDYLGLKDVDNCDWTFIAAGSVPAGPWKQIITTTAGDSAN